MLCSQGKMFAFLVLVAAFWLPAILGQTSTCKLIIYGTYNLNTNGSLSNSLAQQIATALNTTVANVAATDIKAGQVYDNTTYLSVDIFQFSFTLPATLTTSLLSMVTSGTLNLIGTSNNQLEIPPSQDLNANMQLPFERKLVFTDDTQELKIHLSCDQNLPQDKKEVLIAKIKDIYKALQFTLKISTLTLNNCTKGFFIARTFGTPTLNNFGASIGTNLSQFETKFRSQFISNFKLQENLLFPISATKADLLGTLNGVQTVVFKDALIIYPIVSVGIQWNSESSGRTSPDKILNSLKNTNFKWSDSLVDINNKSLYLPSLSPCSTTPVPALVIETLSLVIKGDYCALIGSSEQNFASNLTDQLGRILNISTSFLGGYQSRSISSDQTLFRFNISNFDSQANRLIDIGPSIATFSNLLNTNTLNLVISGSKLVISAPTNTSTTSDPTCTTTTTGTPTSTPTKAADVKLIIVQEFDINSTDSLAMSLARETAAALGVSIESIGSPSIVAGELYDDRTDLSVDAIQFSFKLAGSGRFAQLLAMVNSGTLKLTCPSGSACEIPADQHLQGSAAYDLTGSSQFATAYWQLTQRRSAMNVMRFNLTCSASQSTTLGDTASSELVNQLLYFENILDAKFKATKFVQAPSAPCDRRAIFVYPFKLKILNDYSSTVGDDPEPLLSSIQAQLIGLLKIPADRLLSTFVDRTDVSGSFNGRPAVLLPGVMQLTFNVYQVSVKNEAPFWQIMHLYNQQGNWPLKDLNGNALNAPPQYCRGILQSPLVVQSIAFAIHATFKKTAQDPTAQLATQKRRRRQVAPSQASDSTGAQLHLGVKKVTADDKFAASLKQQLSYRLNVSQDLFGAYQMAKGANETTVFCVNISSFSSSQDISQANATFYQLLNNGTLQLTDAREDLLDVSDVASVRVIKPVKLVIVTKLDAAWTKNDLAANVTCQLLSVIGLPPDRFANVSVTAGELFDAGTNISADVVQLSANLLLDYNDKDSKMTNLAQLVASGRLALKDLNNSPLLVPRQQDLQGNVSHPVAMPPMENTQSGQTRYKLSCNQVPPESDYDIGPLAQLLDTQLAGNPNASLLLFKSTNLTLFDGGGCIEESLVVGIESINVTLLNDFDRLVNGDVANFTAFMKSQLAALMKTTSHTSKLVAMNVSEIDIAGLDNGNWSTSLLQAKVQVSLVKLSMERHDDVVLFDRPPPVDPFNGNRLNVPAQFKNGSTILPLVNQSVAMLIMYRKEWLFEGNSEKDFVTDLKNQLSQGKLINMPVDFFHHQLLIANNSSTKFYLNVSSYYKENVIDVQNMIGKFTDKLRANKLAFKDSNNYPIHILPIDNPYKFIIIPAYDENFMKVWSPVMATVILILVVIQLEIRACIKSCLKRRSTNQSTVFPLPPVDEISQPPTADNFAAEMRTFLQKVIHESRDHLRSIDNMKEQKEANAFNKPANCYRVNGGVQQQPDLQTIGDKASYSPPI